METETKAGLKKVIQLFEDGQPEQAQKVISNLLKLILNQKRLPMPTSAASSGLMPLKGLRIQKIPTFRVKTFFLNGGLFRISYPTKLLFTNRFYLPFRRDFFLRHFFTF